MVVLGWGEREVTHQAPQPRLQPRGRPRLPAAPPPYPSYPTHPATQPIRSHFGPRAFHIVVSIARKKRSFEYSVQVEALPQLTSRGLSCAP